MKLTIILPTHRPEYLVETLDSLAECNLPENFDRLILIENGTSKPTLQDIVDNVSPNLNVSYMHCQEGNKSNALNFVIDQLEENQLLFLTDDDVKFDKNLLKRYVSAAEGKETGFVFGGRIIPDTPFPPPPELEPYIPRSMTGYPKSGKAVDLSNTMFIGSNWAVFSEDVKRQGGFDPRFGPGSKLKATGQETSMMTAMREAGFKFVFIENAVVKHKVRQHQYSVEFLKDRRAKDGAAHCLLYRLSGSNQSKYFPPVKIIVKALAYAAFYPIIRLTGPRSLNYRLMFAGKFARGYLNTWFKDISKYNTRKL